MTEDNKSLQDKKRTKRRRMPYWDAKEVMDNDWKTDGVTPTVIVTGKQAG